MNFDDYSCFKFERKGRVLHMSLNQPDKLNTLAGESHTQLSKVFRDIAEDEESDIVVLTGEGRVFSAGGDIEYMQYLYDNPKEFYRCVREARNIVCSMLECDKIIVAKINGDAIGLGATVAVCCDMIFAADTARFGDPHNNVGLTTGDGGQIMWPQMMGFARAKHYLLTGEKFSAQDAKDMGMINDVVPKDELDAFVETYVEKLTKLPARSLRWSKTTINTPLRQWAASMMDLGMAYENVAAQTVDHQEAINAFREKRKPKFIGE